MAIIDLLRFLSDQKQVHDGLGFFQSNILDHFRLIVTATFFNTTLAFIYTIFLRKAETAKYITEPLGAIPKDLLSHFKSEFRDLFHGEVKADKARYTWFIRWLGIPSLLFKTLTPHYCAFVITIKYTHRVYFGIILANIAIVIFAILGMSGFFIYLLFFLTLVIFVLTATFYFLIPILIRQNDIFDLFRKTFKYFMLSDKVDVDLRDEVLRLQQVHLIPFNESVVQRIDRQIAILKNMQANQCRLSEEIKKTQKPQPQKPQSGT